MASATGIPEENPATQGRGEDEPLLGRAGDASQQDGKGIQFNFVLGTPTVSSHTRHALNADPTLPGTAIIAQAGIWIVRGPQVFVKIPEFTDKLPAHRHRLGLRLYCASLPLLCTSCMSTVLIMMP